jgi:hypothetical protein
METSENHYWEWFLDESYYDKYAVRHTSNKSFYAAIHVNTREESEFLVKELNDLQALRAKVANLERNVEALDRSSGLALKERDRLSQIIDSMLCPNFGPQPKWGPAPIDRTEAEWTKCGHCAVCLAQDAADTK